MAFKKCFDQQILFLYKRKNQQQTKFNRQEILTFKLTIKKS